ncbi:LytR family transcriptional regulator [Pseudonocardiaceae bacterium YIM PH 21723]|nr:LytR family transcriptional regulator [Pseudonocardiaceae bacterium YIM PH 21723]
MSSPEPTGSPSPMKIGGIALLGIGVIALVIGIVDVATGGSSTSAAESPSSSASASSSATPSSAPTSLTTPSTTGGWPKPEPSSSTSTAPAPPPPPAQVRSAVRVYNNGTQKGLAARATQDIQHGGWTVTETANYASGTIPTSTVYYRPGTDEQASAEQLGAMFGMRVEERFEGLKSSSPGVIVIVTNDYKGPQAK